MGRYPWGLREALRKLGEPTDQYLAYPLRMLDLFERHGVTP